MSVREVSEELPKLLHITEFMAPVAEKPREFTQVNFSLLNSVWG
jgi:hypothetical protein